MYTGTYCRNLYRDSASACAVNTASTPHNIDVWRVLHHFLRRCLRPLIRWSTMPNQRTAVASDYSPCIVDAQDRRELRDRSSIQDMSNGTSGWIWTPNHCLVKRMCYMSPSVTWLYSELTTT